MNLLPHETHILCASTLFKNYKQNISYKFTINGITGHPANTCRNALSLRSLEPTDPSGIVMKWSKAFINPLWFTSNGEISDSITILRNSSSAARHSVDYNEIHWEIESKTFWRNIIFWKLSYEKIGVNKLYSVKYLFITSKMNFCFSNVMFCLCK